MTKIIGKAVATAEQMAAYLLSANPEPQITMPVLAFCRLYLYIGALEGVRGDVLFAQSLKETGNFKFMGTVKADQNNYAGLGTTDANTPGATFPDEATGILAQAQHAKGYDGTALNYDCVDPRYSLLVKYGKTGTAQNWEELGGKWAVPGYDTEKYASLDEADLAKDSYGWQIMNILDKILGKSEETERKEEVTVKKRVCIDAGHFGRYNRSPGVPEYYESEVMWKLHLLQKKHLEEKGIEVVTTRSKQEKDLGLTARGKASKGCDLFISDHSNAVGGGMDESIDYVAVYRLSDDTTTKVDDISKEIAKKIAPVIANIMGTEAGSVVRTRNSDKDRNNDGFKNDNYYGVLHGARLVETPGLILEHSFHTNTKMVKWLLDDDNLDRLARAEAECIAEYLLSNDAQESTDLPYLVKVTASMLNVRNGAGSNYKINTTIKNGGVFTIVAEKDGWGKLKSGAGWISLKYTERV